MGPLHRAVRRLRQRSERAAAGEAGFTLIEVVIATSILFVAMASIAYLGTVAFADVAIARLRQTGTALANQTLEEVRALPYATVARGLSNADLVSSGDPNITFADGNYRFDGEQIPRGDNPTVAPVVPHTSTTTVDGVAYTTRVYVTYYENDPTSGAFRVTAIVSWAASLRPSVGTEAQVQTVLYSPQSTSSCQSTATHPFPAPCQPFFYSNATTTPGAIRFTRDVSDTPMLESSILDEAVLWLPTETTDAQVEQVQRVVSSARTSGATIRNRGVAAPVETTRVRVDAQSDSDPSQVSPIYSTRSDDGPAHTTWSIGATGSNSTSLTLASTAGDTVSATATVLASAANACADAAAIPLPVTNSQPCGQAVARQVSNTHATLSVPATGNYRVAQLSAPAMGSAAHTARSLVAVPACPTASGEGCVIASKRQTLGNVLVGGIPAGWGEVLPGFDYLVKLTDVQTTVTAAAGIGSGNPTVSRSGTLTYWDTTLPVAAYTTVDLGSLGSAGMSLPPITLDASAPTTGIRVRMVADLRVGSTSAVACAAPCQSAEATARSPLLGTITYQVLSGNVVVVSTVMNIDLGTLSARATYQPSA